jgi:hypothetical protein
VFKGAAYVRLPKDAPRLNPEYTTNYHDVSGSKGGGAKGGGVKTGNAVDSCETPSRETISIPSHLPPVQTP